MLHKDPSLDISILFCTCWVQIFLQFKQDGVTTNHVHSHCIPFVSIQLHDV